MVRTKLTARGSYEKNTLPMWLLSKEYGKRRVYPFKIKQNLPVQKGVNIKKDGQIIKTVNVRRKSKYFIGNNRLIF